jgi:hypothetical protein
MGESPRTKRDSSTGEFIDQKKAPAKKKFKGVRREKGRLIWRRGLQGSTDSLAQAKEEEGLRRLGYQNIRSRYQTRYRVDAKTAVTISIEGTAELYKSRGKNPRRRPTASDRTIQSGRGAPSRCRPPAHAAAQAATAPSKTAVATENARIMLLRRDFAIAVLALAIALSTRRSASVDDRPVNAPTS